jgi:hypothetical protein
MRRHHPRLPSKPAIRIRARVVTLFPKRLHQFWPLWRRRRCPNPYRQLPPRQGRMMRHPLTPRLSRAFLCLPRRRCRRRLRYHPQVPPTGSLRDLAQLMKLIPRCLHQLWPIWRRYKRPHRCCKLRAHQRRTGRHRLRRRILRAANRSIQDHARMARLESARGHPWRRKKHRHRRLQLPHRLRTALRK